MSLQKHDAVVIALHSDFVYNYTETGICRERGGGGVGGGAFKITKS